MNSYRLIIADDEPAPREGLRAVFENNEWGFEVVGVADGGLQALAMAQERRPDVLLTDIRMPDMDGLELAGRCAKLPEPPKLLIMSSYDDTVYIKSALKLQAVDYLFKPLDLAELEKVMKQIHDRLDEEARSKRERIEQREKLKHGLAWLRVRFLQEYADGKYEDARELEERLSFLDMKLPKTGEYAVVCISADARDMNAEAGKEQGSTSVPELLEDVLSLHGEGYVAEYEKNHFLILVVGGDAGRDELITAAEQIGREVCDALLVGGIHAMDGFERTTFSRAEIPAAFHRALEKAQRKLMLGKERTAGANSSAGEERNRLLNVSRQIREELAGADQETLTGSVDQFFEVMERRKDISLLYAIQCASLLVSETGKALADRNRMLEESQEPQFAAYEKLMGCETIPEMKTVMTDYLNSLRRELNSGSQNALEGVEKIKEIVGEQYMNNLTIQTIAEQIYLTPNYICMIFKQMTGLTINQYITEVRIDRAKKYLENPAVKLAEIGVMVGYTEPSYFSKIFKRYVALTPREYRQLCISLQERQKKL